MLLDAGVEIDQQVRLAFVVDEATRLHLPRRGRLQALAEQRVGIVAIGAERFVEGEAVVLAEVGAGVEIGHRDATGDAGGKQAEQAQ